ncbi:hypothetical protein ACFC3Z_12325 [Enterococcus thailandicus]|uniref:hypothetical protein n=1 Tax=Enterococcus thailandicus TaxID=417368 RepID=UPI0035D85B73
MPRNSRKKPSGNFDSVFDDELDILDTPEDTIESLAEEEVMSDPVIPEELPVKENTAISTPNATTAAEKFGLNKKSSNAHNTLVARTFKYDEEALKRIESLIYKDQKQSKKIPGTKGFISDFMDNAIWQHLYQLGLATEEEVNAHLKDYSKYPLNFDNISDK